jgi:hypothetical protein
MLLQHKDSFQAFKIEFFSKPDKKIRILKAYGKQDFSSSMPSKIKLMLKENPPSSCAMYVQPQFSLPNNTFQETTASTLLALKIHIHIYNDHGLVLFQRYTIANLCCTKRIKI